MMQFGAYLSPKRGLLASACLPRGLGTVVDGTPESPI